MKEAPDGTLILNDPLEYVVCPACCQSDITYCVNGAIICNACGHIFCLR